jgi:proteasome lid subunit RPN8/RPN11
MSELTEQAVEMAEAGYSLEEIAKTFDTTRSVVSTSIWRELKRTKRRPIRLFLTDRTYEILKEEADARGLEVAGIVRTIIAKHIRQKK